MVLKCTTPYGTFKRRTDRNYTHVLVSLRTAEWRKQQQLRLVEAGLGDRVVADPAVVVSWHQGLNNALKAQRTIRYGCHLPERFEVDPA